MRSMYVGDKLQLLLEPAVWRMNQSEAQRWYAATAGLFHTTGTHKRREISGLPKLSN